MTSFKSSLGDVLTTLSKPHSLNSKEVRGKRRRLQSGTLGYEFQPVVVVVFCKARVFSHVLSEIKDDSKF